MIGLWEREADYMGSTVTHHLAATARCRPESSCAADFHIGTEEHA